MTNDQISMTKRISFGHWCLFIGHLLFAGFASPVRECSCPSNDKIDLGVLQHGLDMDRTLPKLVQVRERVLGVVGLQLDAAVAVLEEQLAAVFVVAVLHINDRPADVREVEQQPLLDLLEFAAFDLVVAGVVVEAERKQLVLAAEIERQELVDERQVVVDAADLEDLLAAQAQLLVPVALGAIVVALFVFLAETRRGSSGLRCRDTARCPACRDLAGCASWRACRRSGRRS